ncbi:hypothetical protein ONZ43_g786 [Nemania bipapillata]|uniref:Uncharacterized protein n=1 Tax=Nemania bipapillata TaxID=110536 RepID=A0ACC2J778_9PEZI|nr:hypothetical protein ONZ43_g786 [Nemania bipapillata]
MCQDIQGVTFFCGHQISFWWGKSRFCLFTGEGKDRFHTTYTSFERSNEKCPRCKIADRMKEQMKAQGKVIKGAEFRQLLDKRYSKTADSREEQSAKYWESLAAKDRSELTADRIADLQLQIMEQIVFYLRKPNITPGAKTILLRTITMLPDVFDRQKLVTFFASRYFREDDVLRQFQDWERRKLFSIVRHARLDRTFKAGLNLETPIPLPIRRGRTEGANNGSAQQLKLEKIEEGVAKMSLSS